ncbi:MAG: M28 family peptidase [Acidobacteria bacterium]|nr:M28 family peptidase [Acidobacteriota bacterium]MCI0620772.1 M28 family peptidase [Acidobacteriota bacterium]MCI0720172.1 M28 family peptidase [Acidobacteriota bacterium]
MAAWLLCFRSLSCLFCASATVQHCVAAPVSGVDGKLAYAHVEKLVAFGPRPAGSPGIASSQAYITDVLKKLKLQVDYQDFLANTPNGPVSMKNIVAKTSGAEPIIILASHYDTRLMTNAAFVGANDGGSSTGLLLELARVLSRHRNRSALWLVFFDGEEAQREWSETDSLYGSRYFVEKLKTDGQAQKIKAMVLMDMVGDRDLKIENDTSSTPWLMELVRESAKELGYARHLAPVQKGMVDDHLPFIRAGIPAVDLIDYDYGFNNSLWHTPNDTLDKVSAQSLKVVGDIVVRVIEKLGRKS